MTRTLVRAHCAIRQRMTTDRGDVPGWVLITIMTASVVVGLMMIVGPRLNEMFQAAMDSVTGG